MSGKGFPTVPDRAEYDPDYFECLLTEAEAARFLNYSVRALQNWRTRGRKDPDARGPKYIGRKRGVRYRRRDLIAWAEANLLEHTSEQSNSAKANAEGGSSPAEPRSRTTTA